MPVLRIAAPRRAVEEDPTKAYLDRLVKLIPAEVVALYLAGRSAILTDPKPDPAYWVGWTIFCLFAVVWVRAWATSGGKPAVGPEWPAVGIAAVSFLVWVYSLGDVFKALGHSQPLLASLLVLAWTFIAPLIYRPKSEPPAA